MPSDKLRRDFAPEPDVLEYLDTVPLMKRSYVINEAIRLYYQSEKKKDHDLRVIEILSRIERKLNDI